MIRIQHRWEREINLILRGTPVMMPLIMFIEKKIQEAKKEVFDDIENSDLFQEHLIHTVWWNDVKQKHLGTHSKKIKQ